MDIEPNPCVPGKCEHVNFINSVRFNSKTATRLGISCPQSSSLTQEAPFSDVTFDMNWGGGILLSLAGNLGNATMPITVRFDDCKV